MKIRNGFVSNSSSTSYIVAVKRGKSDACPHCGRYDPDFIDAIDASGSEWYSENTRVDGSLDAIISDWEVTIRVSQGRIQDERATPGYHSKKYSWLTCTSERFIEYEEKEIHRNQDNIKRLLPYKEDKEWTIFDVQVSYHDDLMRTLLDNCVKNGSVKILRKDGEWKEDAT